jgi:hypothetical protein
MSLPALSNWDSTRPGLHQAAQILGAIRKTVAQPLPNYAHLGLYVTPEGVTTGSLPFGGELSLEFAGRSVVYTPVDGDAHYTSLSSHSQSSLTDAVLGVLKDMGNNIALDHSKLSGMQPLDVQMDVAADYAEALYSVHSAIARFRSRLLGSMSPMIVFPHGFDLSFLWFARGFAEEKDPHMNFGFSPGSPGLSRPYVYVYAHPIPGSMFDVRLPEGARWYRANWNGIVIDYDTLAQESDHEVKLEGMLRDIHAAVAPLMA